MVRIHLGAQDKSRKRNAICVYTINDQLHDESLGKYETLEQAQDELQKLAKIPWGTKPNIPPCTKGLACARDYEIIVYGVYSKTSPNSEFRYAGVHINSKGVHWDAS